MTHKKVKKFHFLKCWLFPLEGWRLLLGLGSPSRRPKNKYIAIFILKNRFFLNWNFFSIFGIKNLDLDLDSDSTPKPESGSIPDSINLDPNQCF